MAGLRVPLPTLHVRPHDRPRMTRGRCGTLLLHRKGLAPSVSRRSPDAPSRFLRATSRRDAPVAEGDLALPDEIEITDRAHPLHGRRFPLLSASGSLRTAGYVWVEYRPGILLMLPIPATSLQPAAARYITTKLCLEALEDLVALAGESGGACPSSPRMSGRPCRRVCGGRLPPTSPQSSGS